MERVFEHIKIGNANLSDDLFWWNKRGSKENQSIILEDREEKIRLYEPQMKGKWDNSSWNIKLKGKKKH